MPWPINMAWHIAPLKNSVRIMERRLCDTTRASFAVNLIIIIFSTCESAIDFIQWYCGYSSSDRKRSCYENVHRTERWRMKNITTRQFSILGDCGKIY
jgi:hypothetical protein